MIIVEECAVVVKHKEQNNNKVDLKWLGGHIKTCSTCKEIIKEVEKQIEEMLED